MSKASALDPEHLNPGDRKSERVPRFCKPVAIPGDPQREVLPNLSDWNSGDILLFSSNVEEKDPGGKVIEDFQRKYSWATEPEQVCWTHAGVYLDRGLYVEALLKEGVVVKPHELTRRAAISRIRVRRAGLCRRRLGGDLEPITWQGRLDIAFAALFALGAKYGFSDRDDGAKGDVIDYAKQALSKRKPGEEPRESAPSTTPDVPAPSAENHEQSVEARFICSKLAQMALIVGAGVTISATSRTTGGVRPPYPCELAACEELNEVQVFWRNAARED